MININQFAQYIVTPALNHIQLYSYEAEQLVVGTALTESKLTFLKQVGSGPALGLFQMEPATHDDILKNYVAFKPGLQRKLNELRTMTIVHGCHPLQHCLLYAAAMCRIHYARVKEPLPKANDLAGMARYWKEHYNTASGAGTPQHFIDSAKAVLTIPRGW